MYSEKVRHQWQLDISVFFSLLNEICTFADKLMINKFTHFLNTEDIFVIIRYFFI